MTARIVAARCLHPAAALLLLLAIAGLLVRPTTAHAAGIRLIQDAEIERLLRDYARPIVEAAGFDARNIRIHIVRNPSFNAFVIDGRNIFMNTGTLMSAETPNQVIGIIAHEMGHIAGAHLSKLARAFEQARTANLVFQVLGIAAMALGAATGGGDVGKVGAATMLGGRSMTINQMQALRRSWESAADQAALSYLAATGQSGRGMLETFERLARDNRGLSSGYEYLRSHPGAEQRIVDLRVRARESRYFDRRDPPGLQLRHDLMRAKLVGFLVPPAKVLSGYYPQSNQSLPARYARAIATFRKPDLPGFLVQADALIAAQPANPYFHELKGDFLFRAGRIADSVPPLRRALKLAPKAPLIRIALAKSLLALKTGKSVDEAIRHLEVALARTPITGRAYVSGFNRLAEAYGQRGRTAEAIFASAHARFHAGHIGNAKQLAKRAKAQLPPGSPKWLQLDDIINYQPPKRR